MLIFRCREELASEVGLNGHNQHQINNDTYLKDIINKKGEVYLART